MIRFSSRTIVSGCIIILIITACILYFRMPPSYGYYHSPIAIPIELAANFGEPRADHFHMGLDIRTRGKEDLPVYAVADGYVSCVKLEQTGFGKCLLIAHKNGTTSLYAHLNKFYDPLEHNVLQHQYADKSWQQSITYDSTIFRVRKGQLIGYSGNTGSSEGPHLHFELRDTRTGDVINPLISAYPVKDNTPPVVKGLYWYDREKSIYLTTPRQVNLANDANSYKGSNILLVNSPVISFGIKAIDQMSDKHFRMGIYSASLFLDDSLIFAFRLNKLSYETTRYVNACIDYEHWLNSHQYIQHLSILPGNRLTVFDRRAGNGTIRLRDTSTHRIRIQIADAAGNLTTVSLAVKYTGRNIPERLIDNKGSLLAFGKPHIIQKPNYIYNFPATAFYDNVPFEINEEKSTRKDAASLIMKAVYPNIPVHTNYIVQIKTSLSERSLLRRHTVMRITNRNTSQLIKGNWQGNYMKGSFDELGNIELLVDTIAPAITTQGWKNNTTLTDENAQLQLLAKDNLGAVDNAVALLDGKWILLYRKDNLFTYHFDNRLQPGKHRLEVTVRDIAGNITSKDFFFTKE
ncbi:peptidoglycan DD-metalloendopeptidase family protein [Danxiaibacter flavus]|uniref:Peptidoglycan DD-metalloendopeptidase family protein n=1 Tax=Danxiaibacter flavus TaxID=3049108 RepID=A0ABV3ZD74_9BACT|nr:peptidoglycan DD-metalloendopeptidase family protein [Chitinophagaceae bacterium DXS]